MPTRIEFENASFVNGNRAEINVCSIQLSICLVFASADLSAVSLLLLYRGLRSNVCCRELLEQVSCLLATAARELLSVRKLSNIGNLREGNRTSDMQQNFPSGLLGGIVFSTRKHYSNLGANNQWCEEQYP